MVAKNDVCWRAQQRYVLAKKRARDINTRGAALMIMTIVANARIMPLWRRAHSGAHHGRSPVA